MVDALTSVCLQPEKNGGEKRLSLDLRSQSSRLLLSLSLTCSFLTFQATGFGASIAMSRFIPELETRLLARVEPTERVGEKSFDERWKVSEHFMRFLLCIDIK